MKMKYFYYLLMISLFFGCYSEEGELVKPEDWCKRITTIQNSLDDSIKSVLWNDSVFTNLCELSDTRKWAYEKYYEGFPDSLFVDYKDIYGELQKYGQKSGIPNIFVYWAAYRKEILSAPILTRTDLPEIIVRGDCYLDDIWNETAASCFALWDNAVHQYWYEGGTTEECFFKAFQTYCSSKHPFDEYYNLFLAVMNPSNRMLDCNAYARIMSQLNITPGARASTLEHLDFYVGPELMAIAHTPEAWRDCGTAAGEGGGISGGRGTGGSISEPKIDLTDIFKQNSKAMGLFNILSKDIKSYFNLLLYRYAGDKGPLDIEFTLIKDAELNNKDARGVCHVEIIDGKGRAVIEIDQGYLESNRAIEVAKTYLHEALHAFIHAYINTSRSQEPTTLEKDWMDYEYKTEPSEHEAMAKRELQHIADELERVHKQYEYDDLWKYLKEVDWYKEGDEKLFYKALAWQGLENTESYQKIDKNEREKMVNLIRGVLPYCKYDWK